VAILDTPVDLEIRKLIHMPPVSDVTVSNAWWECSRFGRNKV